MQVRNSSGNGLTDIYPKDRKINEDFIKTLIGANSGQMKYWYDLTGNGYTLAQLSTGNQPYIVTSGTYENYPTFDYVNASNMACAGLANGAFPQDEFSIFIKTKPIGSIPTGQGVFSSYTNSKNAPFCQYTTNGRVSFGLGYNGGVYNPHSSPNNTIIVDTFNDICIVVKCGVGGYIRYHYNNTYTMDTIANTDWRPSAADFSFQRPQPTGSKIQHGLILLYNKAINIETYNKNRAIQI